MLDRQTIPFQHWSLKVGRADPVSLVTPSIFGEIVSAVDDLHQAIVNLILTPLGSVPTEPEKGCDLYPFIDRVAQEAIPNLTRVIWDALEVWEPRIVVDKVVVSEPAFAHFSCEVFWRPIESVLDDLLKTQVSLTSTDLSEVA